VTSSIVGPGLANEPGEPLVGDESVPAKAQAGSLRQRILHGHSRSGLESGRHWNHDPFFSPTNHGPNAMVDASNLEVVRGRSRYLAANNSLIKGAIRTKVARIVGPGIMPRASTEWQDLNDQINRVLNRAAEAVDISRRSSLAESQRLFAREVLVGGDCGVRNIMGREFKGYPAMPAIELIDPDRIDIGLEGPYNGNHVRQGVEFDPDGREVAYHVLTDNPNDNGPLAFTRRDLGSDGIIRIPAEEMELGRTDERIDQIRGIPVTTTAMVHARQGERVIHNTVISTAIQAAMPIAVEGSGAGTLSTPNNGDSVVTDSQGNPIDVIEGVSIVYLPNGVKLNAIQSTQPGPQVEMLEGLIGRRISRALGTQYAETTGNYRDSNFSSSRKEDLDRAAELHELRIFIWAHHTKAWSRRVIAWAFSSRLITLTREQQLAIAADPELLYECKLRLPGRSYVDPLKEANAAKTELASGVKSRQEVIEERGGDPDQVIKDQVAWELKLREARRSAGLPEQAAAPPAEPSRDRQEQDEDEREDEDEQSGGDEAAKLALVGGS